MRKYVLKTKCGEAINSVVTEGISNAIEMLAEKKKLSMEALVEIYNVEEVIK